MPQIGQTRAAIVGSGQTQLRHRWGDRQHVDLISEAVSEALVNSGLDEKDIDFVIDSGSDVLDGRSISNCGFMGALTAQHREESRVEEDGLWAALYGTMKITSESARIGLIVAYSKPSESSLPAFYATQTEPFIQRPVGMDHLAALGFQAQRYLADHKLSQEAFENVVRHNWESAAINPTLDVSAAPTVEDIRGAALAAAPLRDLEISRPVDGAVALVIATGDIAERLTASPVWITGIGTAMDEHFFALRDPGALAACEAAAQMAYKRAGVTDPTTLSVVETSAGSAAGELMVLEALGLADAGKGTELYDGNGPTVNPSGGSLPADPVMATGLVRLREVAAALTGKSSGMPPSASATSGLAHGTGGVGMQNHAVFVLEV